jgi:carbon-monoxide dehydrogenase small subunit
MTAIKLTVNGQALRAEVEPRTHLADFLREHLLLTGTHIGCEHGICGACTVEIDGEIARSCITYAATCDGARIRTIEGFDDDRLMGRLRQAFTEEHALQCGYCTPGMLIAARDLIRRKGGLDRSQIRAEMSGNLCRCTGYVGIVRAVETVMAERAGFDLPASSANAGWLGPAPGPQASEPAIAAASAARIAVPEVGAQAATMEAAPIVSPRFRRGVRRRPIKVDVSVPEETGGETRLTQSFVLEHPRETVWRIMSNPREVAACMPGMVLDGPVDDGQVTGRMEISLGPIKASFAGKGSISRFDGEYRQVITGSGGDRKSGSNASGRVAYELHPVVGAAGDEATRVHVAMSYALTGPLAQFGRSALVRDLVSRIGESFAQNLDARLSAPEGTPMAPAALGAASLIWRSLITRARRAVARFVGGRP